MSETASESVHSHSDGDDTEPRQTEASAPAGEGEQVRHPKRRAGDHGLDVRNLSGSSSLVSHHLKEG